MLHKALANRGKNGSDVKIVDRLVAALRELEEAARDEADVAVIFGLTKEVYGLLVKGAPAVNKLKEAHINKKNFGAALDSLNTYLENLSIDSEINLTNVMVELIDGAEGASELRQHCIKYIKLAEATDFSSIVRED